MSNFDNVARTWDENPIHLDRSQAIAIKMQETLPLRKEMKALEYGAGTGILSFLLAEKLGHITMMDSSAEMVKVMEEKVTERKVTNLTPVFMNLEIERPYASYDLIFNQMVLHHIKDIRSIFDKFHQMLLPGGVLAIADLYTEDGSFHGEGVDVHLGFDPKQLKKELLFLGFKNLHFEECYTVKREVAGEAPKLFPIFLLTASKLSNG
jgi:ubiquinone/menaquinone biosynthesis C-methylase UbiE